MRRWIRRSLIGLLGVGVLFGGLAACGHQRYGHGGWSNLSEADATKLRERLIDKASRELQLDDAQRTRLGQLADALQAQRATLMAGGNPRAEVQALVAGTQFDRAKAQPTLLARAEVPWQQIAENSRGTPVTAGFDVNAAPSSAVAQNNAGEISRRWSLLASMNKAVNPKMKPPKYPDQDDNAAVPAPVPTAKPVQVANNYPQTLVGAQPANDNVGEGDVADDAQSTVAAMGARNWAIQIGAYATNAIAHSELAAYARKSSDILRAAQQVVIPVQSANGHTIFRARFGPMAERDARELCARLTERGQTCFATMSAR